MEKRNHKVIITGGGTGGHVYPALAIADALRQKEEGIGILFVGAKDRLEMKKVPECGYNIIGLSVEGLHRTFTWKNLRAMVKLINSLQMAGKIVRQYRPDLVVGVGGYASGPVVRSAAKRGIPTLIQEQNSCAGVTNRLLARRTNKICVAYEGMDRYFPSDKIVLTGNPVRKEIEQMSRERDRKEGYRFYGLDPGKKTILILGGSLGARTINEAMALNMRVMENSSVQYLWQTGRQYHDGIRRGMDPGKSAHIVLRPYIEQMHRAYSVADLIISRAGALTISELCIAGKPCILVPSPNVVEDHQTKNARALSERGAAIHIPDREARKKLFATAMELVGNEEKCRQLSGEIRKMSVTGSAGRIVDEIMKLMKKD